MPVHDWTRVEAGIFHAFHVAWIPEIQMWSRGDARSTEREQNVR
jgi:hypothetical protein